MSAILPHDPDLWVPDGHTVLRKEDGVWIMYDPGHELPYYFTIEGVTLRASNTTRLREMLTREIKKRGRTLESKKRRQIELAAKRRSAQDAHQRYYKAEAGIAAGKLRSAGKKALRQTRRKV